jgi:ATP-dependent DNA helicase RecG
VLDPLPADLLARHDLPNLHDAVHEVHFPEDKPRLRAAMRRLVFHELFLIQTGLAARKARLDKTERGARHRGDGRLLNPFLKDLSFGLTGAQERVIEEVLADMRLEKPMRRLLQGDVGSGKTVVAVAALLTAGRVRRAGRDHGPYRGPRRAALPLDVRRAREPPLNVVLLTGSQGAAERREALRQVAAGEAHVVVGTHALIQKGVEFRDLSLVVVDEQHRFGVGQRTVFREKGKTPTRSVMTATPDPADALPDALRGPRGLHHRRAAPGRKPVETRIVDPAARIEAYEEVRRELEDGRQAYVICPLVEESEALEDVRAAEELREELAEEVFPDRTVGLCTAG